MWYVYIIRCEDETLYTGVTTDVLRRLAEHQSFRGAKYTRAHKAVEVVYSERHDSRVSACRREAEIKACTRSQKLQLIERGK